MLPVERGDGQAAVRQSGYRLRIDTKFHGVMLAKPGHHPKIELNPSCRFAMTGNTTRIIGSTDIHLRSIVRSSEEYRKMAMTMSGEYELAAPPQTVWEKLNDPAMLKACIPGCEQLDKTSDTEFQAVATVKIGPVKAKFKGKVTLSDLDPPNGYKISGQGDGGVAGFAKGGATLKLTPKNGGTLLSYNVDAQIGGKLAQLGQRLINGAAKKVAGDFFESFAKAVNPPAG
jgi:carbon monoxide dehydrogenase subunit G